MLRAIAGYFFGGAEDDALSAAVDCETREVNDWLVVSMPDQPVDDVDIDDAADVDESDASSDEEDDDILLSLSILMKTDDNTVSEGSFCEVTDSSGMDSESDSSSTYSLESDDDLFLENWKGNYFDSDVVDRFPVVPFRGFSNCFRPLIARELVRKTNSTDNMAGSVQSYNQIVNYFQSIRREASAFEMTTKTCSHLPFFRCKCPRPVVEIPQQCQKGKEVLQRLKTVKSKPVRNLNATTCHPLYSKTYVNHCHPALSPKTDLLQRIKELDTEQKSTERAFKKHISKGQLNRQNKNYIYDTSNKKNRRKNLQRNPSGANNNRKGF